MRLLSPTHDYLMSTMVWCTWRLWSSFQKSVLQRYIHLSTVFSAKLQVLNSVMPNISSMICELITLRLSYSLCNVFFSGDGSKCGRRGHGQTEREDGGTGDTLPSGGGAGRLGSTISRCQLVCKDNSQLRYNCLVLLITLAITPSSPRR